MSAPSTLLPCLTLWGVADAGVATQHGVVTIRTATALPEKEGVEIDSNRMVVYGRQALPPWTDNQAQHAFAMAADGDHYILTFNAPVNVEDVYVRIESSTYQLMPGKDYIVVQGRIHVPTGICTHTMSYADYMHVYKVCIKTKQDDLGICQGFRGLWLS